LGKSRKKKRGRFPTGQVAKHIGDWEGKIRGGVYHSTPVNNVRDTDSARGGVVGNMERLKGRAIAAGVSGKE